MKALLAGRTVLFTRIVVAWPVFDWVAQGRAPEHLLRKAHSGGRQAAARQRNSMSGNGLCVPTNRQAPPPHKWPFGIRGPPRAGWGLPRPRNRAIAVR